MASLVSYAQCLRGKILPILHKVLQKLEEEETIPNSSSEARIILIKKKDKNIRKLNYRPISCRNIDPNILKILAESNWIQQYEKG